MHLSHAIHHILSVCQALSILRDAPPRLQPPHSGNARLTGLIAALLQMNIVLYAAQVLHLALPSSTQVLHGNSASLKPIKPSFSTTYAHVFVLKQTANSRQVATS